MDNDLKERIEKILSAEFEKIDYLESSGFMFYEIDSLKTKPFGWERDGIRIPYKKIMTYTLASLKEKFCNR
jgi:hypothetical protein